MKISIIKKNIIWLNIGIYLLLVFINLSNITPCFCFALNCPDNNIYKVNCECYQGSIPNVSNKAAFIQNSSCSCVKNHLKGIDLQLIAKKTNDLKFDTIPHLIDNQYNEFTTEYIVNSDNLSLLFLLNSDIKQLKTVKLLI